MKALLVFIFTLALGSTDRIGPTTIFGPSRNDRIKTAIDRNVQWLLSGIRNGTLEGPDLPRAVVAIFLAKSEFLSPGHEIGQELRDRIRTDLTELLRQNFQGKTTPSFIPSVELALFLQALLVSCGNPFDFLGYDLTGELYKSVLHHHCTRGNCTFPSSAMLALCNARATSKREVAYFLNKAIRDYGYIGSAMRLTDEEAFLTMAFGCLESSNYPYTKDNTVLYSSGYRHYPSILTVEDFQQIIEAHADQLGNTTSSVSAIAAAMQNLMYNRRLRVADLPWAVDFLLNSQDEEGSWGQSTLNSFFVLPVLSNKSFLDITCTGKKECRMAVVESVRDAQKLKGCTHILGPLEIKIQGGGGDNILEELEASLGSIQEIRGYLKISRSFPLVSLNFLRDLTVIRGEDLHKKEYSFLVMDNPNLQELWNWENRKNKLSILGGKVLFHFNSKLCPNKIKELQIYTDVMDWDDRDVSPISNGGLVACNVVEVNLQVWAVTSFAAIVFWPNFRKNQSDMYPRSLLGYEVYYRETTHQNVAVFDGTDVCGSDAWTVDDCDASDDDVVVGMLPNLKPSTMYATYVRTYTIASAAVGAQSPIVYFTTRPLIPPPGSVITFANATTVIYLPPQQTNNNRNTNKKAKQRKDKRMPQKRRISQL